MPIQDVRIRGIEYQLKWQPFDTTRLVLNQAFAHIDAGYLDAALVNPNSTLATANGFHDIEELTERSMPRRSTSLMLMQKLPYGLEFSAIGYWQEKMKWSRNTWSKNITGSMPVWAIPSASGRSAANWPTPSSR